MAFEARIWAPTWAPGAPSWDRNTAAGSCIDSSRSTMPVVPTRSLVGVTNAILALFSWPSKVCVICFAFPAGTVWSVKGSVPDEEPPFDGELPFDEEPPLDVDPPLAEEPPLEEDAQLLDEDPPLDED